MKDDPKPAEIYQFLKEYDEGKHPLDAEQKQALKQAKKHFDEMMDKLFAESRAQQSFAE